MKFEYRIKGLGNIKDAKIDIAPFTLIAGENNSGKTFITKSLYSILDTLNFDYLSDKLSSINSTIEKNFFIFIGNLKKMTNKEKELINFLNKFLKDIEKINEEIRKNSDINFNYKSIIKEDIEYISEYIKDREKLKKPIGNLEYLGHIITEAEELLSLIKKTTQIQIIIIGIDEKLDRSFKKNFEITSLSDLSNRNVKSKLSFKIENVGNIEIKKDKFQFSLSKKGIEEIKKLNNILYIDSPIYTKVIKALSKQRNEDDYLKDYPQYVDKLYDYLEKKYIGKADFLYISEKIEKIINGKLNIDNSRVITFSSNNFYIPISLTAMGVTNIGIIDILIRNNSIKKGSFLIIDEPEVHLHPKWQVEFVNILYELAKGGVNVIIASHSIDIVKAVEALIKKDDTLIAVNKMPYNETFKNRTNLEKIEEILEDLASPFYKIYMEGL